MPRYTIVLLAVTLAFTPGVRADAPEAPHMADDPDRRAVIPMNPAGRDVVLAEMRMFLKGVQQIAAGLADDDIETAAAAARSLGLGMAETVPPEVAQQLPMEFRQLGRATHADFDQIAMDLEAMGDSRHALRQLGDTLNKCVACHATWRIETGDLGRGLRP
ncbi:MAG TPA: hypothetical protein ENN42_07270 [Thioalkalivibrio sp.]|nr:hypothetical protein [Thioalkalivibrio sp.]